MNRIWKLPILKFQIVLAAVFLTSCSGHVENIDLDGNSAPSFNIQFTNSETNGSSIDFTVDSDVEYVEYAVATTAQACESETSFSPISGTGSINLTTLNQVNTYFIKLMDQSGNTTACKEVTIKHDDVAPYKVVLTTLDHTILGSTQLSDFNFSILDSNELIEGSVQSSLLFTNSIGSPVDLSFYESSDFFQSNTAIDFQGFTIVDGSIPTSNPSTDANMVEYSFTAKDVAGNTAESEIGLKSSLTHIEIPIFEFVYTSGVTLTDFDKNGAYEFLTSCGNDYCIKTPDGRFKHIFENFPQSEPVIADLNKDGQFDFYVPGNGKVGIAINLGNLKFEEHVLASFSTKGFVAGHLNGDDKIDFYSNYNGSRIFINNGDYTFSSTDDAFSSNLKGAAIVDVDGDLDLDIVVTESGSNAGFHILTNDGSGSFTRSREYTDAGENYQSIHYADLNGDGNKDAIIQLSLHDTLYLENDGAGSYNKSILDSDAKTGIEVIDLDGDTDLDVVVGTFNDLYYWQNDGSGNFTKVPLLNKRGYGFKIADFDTNGKLEIILPEGKSSFEYEVYSYDSGLSFVDSNYSFNQYELPYENSIVRWSDLDSDGKLDMVVAGDGYVAGMKQVGVNHFSRFFFMAVSNAELTQFRLADLDGDLDQDLIYFDKNNNNFHLFQNNNLTFTQTLRTITTSTENFNVGDIDGDGDQDIALVKINPSRDVAWMENLGNFNFTDYTSLNYNLNERIGIIVEDSDGDGDGDILLKDDDSLRVLENSSGTFNHVRGHSVADGTLSSLDGGSFLDLDNDGDSDFIQYYSSSDEIIILTNNGNFNFSSQAISTTQSFSHACSIDLNHDGHLDIFAEAGSNTFTLLNDGAGNFTRKTYPINSFLSNDQELDCLDVDGDGFKEVIRYDGNRIYRFHFDI